MLKELPSQNKICPTGRDQNENLKTEIMLYNASLVLILISKLSVASAE